MPFSASFLAICLPMPDLVPVTTATRPIQRFAGSDPKQGSLSTTPTHVFKMAGKRVRLLLEFPSLKVRKCWFLFSQDSCKIVSDLLHLISKKFNLVPSSGLEISLDDYVILHGEDIDIIRDNDLLRITGRACVRHRPANGHVASSTTTCSSSSSSETESAVEQHPSKIIKPTNSKETPNTINGSTTNKALGNRNCGITKKTRTATVKKSNHIVKASKTGGTHITFDSSSDTPPVPSHPLRQQSCRGRTFLSAQLACQHVPIAPQLR